MLHGFNLKLDGNDYSEYLESSAGDFGNIGDFRKVFDDLVEKDGVIDGDELENSWFPLLKNKHVFISHSHSDEALAKSFSAYLFKHYGLNSFLDSTVWGYADDLIKTINDRYSKLESGDLYSYEKCHVTASHIYTLLINALNLMIDHCECLFFINTDNSVDTRSLSSRIRSGESTYSPWLMSELRTSGLIRRQSKIERSSSTLDSASLEGLEGMVEKSANMNLRITYSLPTDHLHAVDAGVLRRWHEVNRPYNREYDALTDLYNIAAGCKYQQNARLSCN